MSREGDSWNNTVAADSFLHILKVETTHSNGYNTQQEAKMAILDFIEKFCNPRHCYSYPSSPCLVDLMKKNEAYNWSLCQEGIPSIYRVMGFSDHADKRNGELI